MRNLIVALCLALAIPGVAYAQSNEPGTGRQYVVPCAPGVVGVCNPLVISVTVSGGTFNNNSDGVASSATNGQAAAWLYGWNGATWDRLTVDANKNLKTVIFQGASALGATNGLYSNLLQGNAVISLSNPVTMGVNTGNAVTAPHICGSTATAHITTATDTQIVNVSSTKTIYVCDYEISFGGTGNIYLEKATSGTCATLTQIAQTWYGVANAGKAAGNAYYRGLNTGASAQLCANTSAGVPVDITVYYDQY